MELRARIRPHLRRASFAAASVALLASATAGLAATDAHAKPKKKKAPRITAIAPKHVAVGQTLTIRGRNFLVGRSKNTVVFKRKGARAVFAKADVSTKKVLRVKVPATLQKFFALKAGNPVPTVFRLRILAARFGKKFTGRKLSPIVSGPVPTANQVVQSPDGDCDKDGVKNRYDADDDNDLLTDATEVAIGTVPCNADSDGDGVEDGYEFQSAKDLNDDEHQNPNQNLPYPGKRPYPNPLYADADRDYDGDSLTLANEQALWRYSYSVSHMATRTLTRLSYSDGMQYSLFSYESGDHGRRHPAQPSSTYPMQARFLSWASTHGYGQVRLSTSGTYDAPVGGVNGLYDIRDVDLERHRLRERGEPGRRRRRVGQRRRARRGRRRALQLPRVPRPAERRRLLERLLQHGGRLRERVRRHPRRRPRHRRRRDPRRRRRPGSRRRPEPDGGQPDRGVARGRPRGRRRLPRRSRAADAARRRRRRPARRAGPAPPDAVRPDPAVQPLPPVPRLPHLPALRRDRRHARTRRSTSR